MDLFTKRLHSSRMRTARALTVSPSMLCTGGVGGGVPGPGGSLLLGGVPGPGGCLLPGVYLVLGGVCSWRGVPGLGSVPGLGGCTWSGGCLLPRKGGVPGQVLPPCGQTHACKHITLPKLRLRAVKTVYLKLWTISSMKDQIYLLSLPPTWMTVHGNN